MARRQRKLHRAEVAGADESARARLLIALDALVDADGRPIGRRSAQRWFPLVPSGDASLEVASGPTLIVDAFGYELHLGDSGGLNTGDHVGHDFVDHALEHGVEVRIVDTDRHPVDIRRTGADDIDRASHDGALHGAIVPAFEVAVR